MKILVGEFITESNANIPQKCEISNYKMLFGDDCIQALHVADVFEQAGFELIPSVVADAGAAGVIKKDTFDYIESCFVRTVKEHIHEIDGMFLMLHGASEVEDIGSGDHHILKEVRKLVGPYMPIVVACDPHGNLCKEYVDGTTVIRSYRESPHTDLADTVKTCCRYLVDLLEHRRNIRPAYRKLPLILGGEQSVSGDEPVRSINEYMDKLEQDPHIRSVSWHVGYIRHDTPVAGCGIVVVPQTEADLPYAEEAADWLAVYVWNKRREFHYTGLTAAPDKALRMALEFEGKPAFITDSGDNVTSGATGWNTYILRQVLVEKELKKKPWLANPHQVYIANDIAYVVARDGDTFQVLGKEFDISWKKLVKYNDLHKEYTLEAGDIIYLKEKRKKAAKPHTVYIVKDGDSMHTISQKYGIRLKNLYKMNRKDAEYVPEIGDRLRLR